MKFVSAITPGLIALGFVSSALADPNSVSAGAGNNSSSSQTGSYQPGSSQTTTSSTATPPPEEGVDDTLYHDKSGTKAGAGVMLRDDGVLTERARAKERVIEIDSTKKLPTSGSDPKFSGSLLNLGPGSIDNLTLKGSETNNTGATSTTKTTTQANPLKQSRERDTQKKLAPLSDSAKMDLSLKPEASASASPASNKDAAAQKP